MEEEFEAVSKPDRSISHKASLDAKNEKGLNEISSIEAEGSVSGRSTPCSCLRGESRRRKSTSSNSSSSTRSATPKRRASHENHRFHQLKARLVNLQEAVNQTLEELLRVVKVNYHLVHHQEKRTRIIEDLRRKTEDLQIADHLVQAVQLG